MIEEILHSQNKNGGKVANFKDMDNDKKLEIIYALLISGCKEVSAAIHEKLIADHALAALMLCANGSQTAKHYSLMAFHSDVYAALEPIIQAGIETYNQETADIQSIAGDAMSDAGHKTSDFGG